MKYLFPIPLVINTAAVPFRNYQQNTVFHRDTKLKSFSQEKNTRFHLTYVSSSIYSSRSAVIYHGRIRKTEAKLHKTNYILQKKKKNTCIFKN